MILNLRRKTFSEKSTVGELTIDGVFECYTLEDRVRPVTEAKLHGRTAIPAGTYRVIITPSNRFKRPLPLLVDVPGFDGIRIHPGNTDADTDGCILVGNRKGVDFIGESRDAFGRLFAKLARCLDRKESVKITIV
jgi:hypothetical protein